MLASRLSECGLTVAMADAELSESSSGPPPGTNEPIRCWTGAKLIDCQGHAGAFQITLDQNGRRTIHRAESIVVAEQLQHTPNFDFYDLSPSKRVLAISQAETALIPEIGSTPAGGLVRVLFLNDWSEHCHPVTAARMLRLCRSIQQSPNVRTVYLTGQLKVSVEGMEACCQAAKAAGTKFFKFDREAPRLQVLKDGRIQATCWDDTTRIAFGMTFDYVVVDEKIAPNSTLSHLARALRLHRDCQGFVQSDNVHRLSNSTNRRGIFAVGGARAVFSPEEQQADAAHAALKVSELLAGLDEGELPRAEIDAGRCARCLTCYRLCPHAAIEMSPRMTIAAQACQSCGLCAAGCPNRAIRFLDDQLTAALQRLIPEKPDCSPEGSMDEPFTPCVVAFCCSRSALPARDMAISAGHRLPAGLVVVEGICGGGFSVRHLLSALEAGADGVMVLTCHPGNCRSENGPSNAAQRAAAAAHALALSDIGADRLYIGTLAANMGTDFVRSVEEFSQKISSLGPILGQR